jgi:transcriptional regulator
VDRRASSAGAGQGLRVSSPFETFRPEDVRDLIAAYPLAWVSVGGEGVDEPTLLPMIGEYDADGALTGLIGHLARRNPLCAAMRQAGRARFLFCGPQAYVSPSQAGRRDWAPTWNFASLRIEAEVTLDDDHTRPAIDALAVLVEAGRDDPWSAEELGPRYAQLSGAIIGFRARVLTLRGVFKLGQDERAETFASIVERHPDADLVTWMRRFDARR